MLNPICVHEAGHAAVLWQFLRKIPSEIVVRLSQAKPDAECRCDIGRPRDVDEALKFAAYFEGGRAAVACAIELGCLPSDTNSLVGFSDPAGVGSDSHKIELLQEQYPGCARTAPALAEREVKGMWVKIVQLATALETQGTVGEAQIRAILMA